MPAEAGAERGGRSAEPGRAAEGGEESAALFIPPASTGVFSVPGMVNLNFHAIVHRDAIYFKDSINPRLPLISQGCYIKRVYALRAREQVCTFCRASLLRGLQLV